MKGFFSGENAQNVSMPMRWLIDALAHAGKTQADLARAIGRNPSVVNRMVRGKRKLQTSELAAVAELLGISLTALHQKLGDSRAIGKQSLGRVTALLPIEGTLPFQPVEMPRSGQKDLRVLGLGAAGKDGAYEFNGQTVDFLERPAKLAHAPDAYAIFNRGSSMEPRYFEDEALYVHPGRAITKGCFVVVQLQPENDGDTPRALVKQFLRQDDAKIVLHQFNPEKDIEIARKRVLSLHRIVQNGEA
jgi:phage repressor protein C with HTH and peptisase S24 domain